MRKRDRKRDPRRRERPPAGPPMDLVALGRLARFVGLIDCDGEPIALIEPLSPIADQMDFDRRVCLAGLKSYIRPRAADDWPEGLPDPGPPRQPHVIVREVTPGFRVRHPATFYPFHEVN